MGNRDALSIGPYAVFSVFGWCLRRYTYHKVLRRDSASNSCDLPVAGP